MADAHVVHGQVVSFAAEACIDKEKNPSQKHVAGLDLVFALKRATGCLEVCNFGRNDCETHPATGWFPAFDSF